MNTAVAIKAICARDSMAPSAGSMISLAREQGLHSYTVRMYKNYANAAVLREFGIKKNIIKNETRNWSTRGCMQNSKSNIIH